MICVSFVHKEFQLEADALTYRKSVQRTLSITDPVIPDYISDLLMKQYFTLPVCPHGAYTAPISLVQSPHGSHLMPTGQAGMVACIFGFIAWQMMWYPMCYYIVHSGVLIMNLQDTDPGLVIIVASTVRTASALDRLRQLVSCTENFKQLPNGINKI